MKTRNGFISNSSSASFVIIGYKTDEIFTNNADKEALIRRFAPKILEDESYREYGIDEVWYDFFHNENFGIEGVRGLSDDGPGYIGVVLADVSSEESYLKSSVTSWEDVAKKIQKLQEVLGITNPPKIYTGTRSC